MCDAQVEEWERAWTNPENEDRLLHYFPPRFSLLRRRPGDQTLRDVEFPVSPGEAGYAFEPVPGEHEVEVLANLLDRGGDRFCPSEGPGAGKSIFTRRVRAFMSSQAGRDTLFECRLRLAFHWEEWSLDGRFRGIARRGRAPLLRA